MSSRQNEWQDNFLERYEKDHNKVLNDIDENRSRHQSAEFRFLGIEQQIDQLKLFEAHAKSVMQLNENQLLKHSD